MSANVSHCECMHKYASVYGVCIIMCACAYHVRMRACACVYVLKVCVCVRPRECE